MRVICFMLGKIPLSTLSARAPLCDSEKTCATVNCGSQIERLSFINLQKKKGTMKPRRSRRASGGGQTIGQALVGELSSEDWENAASARGRPVWAEEVQPTRGEGPESAKCAFRKIIAFTGRR